MSEQKCLCGHEEQNHPAAGCVICSCPAFHPRNSWAPEPGEDGVGLIASERLRQLAEKGYTPEHDDEHQNGEMAEAAACYCLVGKISAENAIIRTFRDNEDERGAVLDDYPMWPWGFLWWKPTGDPIRDLTKAGALIAAELDRLLRQSKSENRESKIQ